MNCKINTSEELRNSVDNICWGWLMVDNMRIAGSPAVLRQDFMSWQAELSKVYDSDSMAALPRFTTTKAMFNALNATADTDDRVEWMKRVLSWRGGNYVNSATDVAMHCAIRFNVPIGVYDVKAIKGDLSYQKVENYQYIDRQGKTSFADGCVLCDAEGVFASPPADPLRSMVNLKTSNVLLAVLPNRQVTEEDISTVLSFAAGMLIGYNRGEVIAREICSN